MKRNPAIQPLSRQHHTLLLAVLLLKKGIAKNATLEVMVAFLNEVWNDVLQPHLQQEEEILMPLFPHKELEDENKIILAEHTTLKDLFQQLNDEKAAQEKLKAFADLLEKHIRYEERIYFPKVEELADVTTLEKLSERIKEVPGTCLQFTPKFWE